MIIMKQYQSIWTEHRLHRLLFHFRSKQRFHNELNIYHFYIHFEFSILTEKAMCAGLN